MLDNNYNERYDSIRDDSDKMAKAYGYDLSKYNIGKTKARLLLRNAVKPEDGKLIFDTLTEQ
jgi:hypothetical protein